ncbi:hypothetical protein JNUCC0626_10390 [Lentzea sp. JNUCC 0626]|uniref:hypothetical protein n=1 Tax=Lentzea sp. JNUCC 0626 TaxID=3367513 RepID=UPI0037493EE6
MSQERAHTAAAATRGVAEGDGAVEGGAVGLPGGAAVWLGGGGAAGARTISRATRKCSKPTTPDVADDP